MYKNNIGQTTFKVVCNDASGFAIYAIGYTNYLYGNSVLAAGSPLASTNNIITGIATSGDTSNWAMKVAAVSGDYSPTIEADANSNSFTNYHVVPESYTKIASFASATDGAVGSSITATYAVYISTTQPAGTYTGQVKYTIVHPASAAAPLPRNYMQEVTNAELASLMPNEGDSTTLYDKRDESAYQITKINGAYWMTQNLRIAETITADLSNFTGDDFDPCTGDLTSGNDYTEPRCHVPTSTEIDTFNANNGTQYTANDFGVWYNYAAASAGTITGNTNSTASSEDICPSGWHLPTYDTNGGTGTINSITGSNYVTAFSPVTGGDYGDGSPTNTGSGYWWSATANGSTNRYRLGYNGSSLSTTSRNRSRGGYVRCTRTQ